jgi:hypothetical protein
MTVYSPEGKSIVPLREPQVANEVARAGARQHNRNPTVLSTPNSCVDCGSYRRENDCGENAADRLSPKRSLWERRPESNQCENE